MSESLSNKTRHFFHVVSNVRPIAWIGLYVALVPVFAVIYYFLPAGQFRIPDGGGVDFGSWLYYSIVTITTLGFGDYTPMHGMAQCVTAVEVMCGLIILGFFLNAVGSMKSEIDVESEIEKQRRLKAAAEKDKLVQGAPTVLHVLNHFIDFTSQTGNSTESLLKNVAKTALTLDTLQSRIDLSQWPTLLENCFTFVADYQIFSTSESKSATKDDDVKEFITTALAIARRIETDLTEAISNTTSES